MPVANTNSYIDLGDGRTLIRTRKGDEFFINSEDTEIARRHCWMRHEHGYARAVTRTPNGLKTVYLHRLICSTTSDRPHVDHINRDPSDCTRSNLRACNRFENLRNQKTRSDSCTGIKGVGFHKQTGKYRARVRANGEVVNVGLFQSAQEAMNALVPVREAMHGVFVRHA